MAFAETANLAVKLTLGGNFVSQMQKATGSLKKFNADASRGYKAGAQIGTGIKRGAAIAAAGVGFLATQVAFGVDSLIKLEDATAQTNAVLKSTKGISGQTTASILNLANTFESLNATMDDTVIQSGANVLLTFTNIRKNAFEPALRSALDLSTAMHQDLQTSVVQLGKALNDPITGLTSLQRIGVSFSDVQKKQIKGFYDLTKEQKKHVALLEGQKKGSSAAYVAGLRQVAIQKAQAVILKEINTEFGGSFAAGGQTTAGQFASVGDAIDDLQRTLAKALLPSLSNVAHAIKALFNDPATIASVSKLGQDIADLFSPANISKGIGVLKDGFGALRAIAGPIADIMGKAIAAFTSLPPDIQKMLVGGFAVNKLTGGLVTNIFGGIADAITKGFIKAPLVNVQGGVVNVGGGIPGGGGLPGAVGAAGLSTAAALSIGGGALLVGLIAAVNSPLWVKNTAINTKNEESGLTQAERAAQTYYTASAADQAEMRKHLSFLPTLADFESGNAKLASSFASGSQESASQLRNAAHDLSGAAGTLKGGAADIKANIKKVIDADRAARGLKGPFHTSTSLQPRFDFLAGNHSGTKDTAVANAIALGFERGATPLFRKTALIPNAIKALEKDRKQLLAHGDTKSAAAIAAAIKRLKITATVRNMKPPKVDVHLKAGATTTVTNTNVKVLVTAGGIKRSVSIQTRHGRTSGSRVDDRFPGYSLGTVT